MAHMEFSGIDELGERLNRMSQKATDLADTQVALTDLLTDAFMESNTDFSSFDEMLHAGGFVVESAEDFDNIPCAKLDELINAHSKFVSWNELLSEASSQYILSQLGI